MLQKTVEAHRNGVLAGAMSVERGRQNASCEERPTSLAEHNTGRAGAVYRQTTLLCLGLLLLCAVRKQSNSRARRCVGLGYAS